MEKQAIIKELNEKKQLWNKIIPLTVKSTTAAAEKAGIVDQRDADATKRYTYNPHIKISNPLPVNTAAAIEDEIALRHKKDCLTAAQKRRALPRVLFLLGTLVGIIFALIPHISNFIGDNLDAYAAFGEAIGFVYQGDEPMVQVVIHGVLAVFAALFQMVAILFWGFAASSLVKAKACARVPELGSAKPVLWIVFTLIVGAIALVTWLLTDLTGMLGFLPNLLFLLIFLPVMASLKASNKPEPTLAEANRLAAARAQDAANEAANEAARKEANAKEQKKFADKQKKFAEQCEKQITAYDQQIDQFTTEIAGLLKQVPSEILSQQDNNLDTIDRLLNLLENGRADTLKEALHMVDMEKEREKDRENEMAIARMKMENDRFIADLDRQQAKWHNDQIQDQLRDHNRRVQDEQRRHNAEVEAHNREMQQELDRLKREYNL